MLTKLLRLKSAPQPTDAADGVAAALACVMGARVTEIVASAAFNS
jgi:Holliday junction resolvasome RuvABC endonuclease subunit